MSEDFLRRLVSLLSLNDSEHSAICDDSLESSFQASRPLNFSESSFSLTPRRLTQQDSLLWSPTTAPKVSKHYKTEMCRRFLMSPTGDCIYGQKCKFAHGFAELRISKRHLLFKTRLCEAFRDCGICPYATQCAFIHNETEEELVRMRARIRASRNETHLLPFTPN